MLNNYKLIEIPESVINKHKRYFSFLRKPMWDEMISYDNYRPDTLILPDKYTSEVAGHFVFYRHYGQPWHTYMEILTECGLIVCTTGDGIYVLLYDFSELIL